MVMSAHREHTVAIVRMIVNVRMVAAVIPSRARVIVRMALEEFIVNICVQVG